MPVMDGVEATRRIRSSSSRGRDVPIVAMTAYSMSGDRERLLASGMNDYIAKPVAKEELIKVIKRTLNR
jgi:CheY-like chemotaxis protein